jgi:hypothetical protein
MASVSSLSVDKKGVLLQGQVHGPRKTRTLHARTRLHHDTRSRPLCDRVTHFIRADGYLRKYG